MAQIMLIATSNKTSEPKAENAIGSSAENRAIKGTIRTQIMFFQVNLETTTS